MTPAIRSACAPGRWPVVGHALALWRHPLEFLVSLPTYGDLVEISLEPLRMVVVCSPELTHRMLRDGHTFDKGGPFYEQLKILLGGGLVTCAHRPHRRQRRLLQPAFSQDRLAVYATEMSRQLDAVLVTWQDGQAIDVLAAMDEITTMISARTLFSAALSLEQFTEFLRNLTVIVEGMFLRMLMPAWLTRAPLSINRRFTRALSTVDALTYQIITTYRREGIDHGDLLSTMLAARDEDGDALTDTEIRDQVLTFWGAGTETTASLLAWSLHLLGQHPEVAQQVHAEVDDVLGGRVATHDDVPHLDYTTRVLIETLRLYPPVWLVTRVLTTQTALAKTTLPAGTTLAYSPYLIQRRADLYPDPDHLTQTGGRPTASPPCLAAPSSPSGVAPANASATPSPYCKPPSPHAGNSTPSPTRPPTTATLTARIARLLSHTREHR